MTNWDHVANSTARALLNGTAKADYENMSIALDVMFNELVLDAEDLMLPEKVFFGRSDALEQANDAYMNKDKGLCMNRIKTFYSM